MIADHLDGNEVFAEAYLDAGDQAAHSADPEFREALARLVAAGLRPDVRVDEVAYWVTVMRRLEPAHLRYLKTVHSAEGKPTRIPGLRSTGPYNHWKVANAAKMPVGVTRSVADHLVQLGLLDTIGDGKHSFAPNTAGRALYLLCVQIDQEAGDQPASD